MKRLKFGFLLGLLALAVVACTGGGCAQNTPVENVLHRAMPADPETLDPQKTRSTQAEAVLRDLGEGLLRLTPELQIPFLHLFTQVRDKRWHHALLQCDQLLAGLPSVQNITTCSS